MAKLIYVTNVSLDGYIEDEGGAFDLFTPDDDVFASTTWQAASKVIYTTTLAAVSTANTRIERHFDPGAVHELKAAASSDLTIGGANLAASYSSATALWDSDRQPCPARRPPIERPVLYPDAG